MNLVEIIDLNAEKFGDKANLRYNGQTYTFAQVKQNADKAAAALQAWGVQKGDLVAIMSFNTPAYVFAFFGALKAGAAVVPVNHKLAAPEVDYILEHSGASVFLFDGALAQVAAKVQNKARKASIDTPAEGFESFDAALDGAGAYRPVAVVADDLAEILYTSGTTGKPKGCLHSHNNVLMAGLNAGGLGMKMDDSDILLMAMPIWHSSPLNNWFMAAQYVGATTVLLREYHPLFFLQAIQDEHCTVYFGAPISYIMPLQMLPNFGDFDLSSMRCFIYGGGPISGDVAKMLMEKYGSTNFYQVYGMSESGPTGTFLPPEMQVAKAGSIGNKSLPGSHIKVMGEDGNPVQPGQAGEIWLRGETMMSGYLNDENATKAAFDGPWYKSGDVARVDEDGYLYIVDRKKDMIVTGGENVYSKEVEDAISAHSGVAEAAVIGRAHPEWGETVTAVVVPAAEGAPTEDELRAFLTERLAKYKIPREIEFRQELPHTPTGKIQKYLLRD